MMSNTSVEFRLIDNDKLCTAVSDIVSEDTIVRICASVLFAEVALLALGCMIRTFQGIMNKDPGYVISMVIALFWAATSEYVFLAQAIFPDVPEWLIPELTLVKVVAQTAALVLTLVLIAYAQKRLRFALRLRNPNYQGKSQILVYIVISIALLVLVANVAYTLYSIQTKDGNHLKIYFISNAVFLAATTIPILWWLRKLLRSEENLEIPTFTMQIGFVIFLLCMKHVAYSALNLFMIFYGSYIHDALIVTANHLLFTGAPLLFLIVTINPVKRRLHINPLLQPIVGLPNPNATPAFLAKVSRLLQMAAAMSWMYMLGFWLFLSGLHVTCASNPGRELGWGALLARGGVFVLIPMVPLVILTGDSTIVSLLRTTWLGNIIPVDKTFYMHKHLSFVSSIAVCSHIAGHIMLLVNKQNWATLKFDNLSAFPNYLWPLITGVILMGTLIALVVTGYKFAIQLHVIACWIFVFTYAAHGACGILSLPYGGIFLGSIICIVILVRCVRHFKNNETTRYRVAEITEDLLSVDMDVARVGTLQPFMAGDICRLGLNTLLISTYKPFTIADVMLQNDFITLKFIMKKPNNSGWVALLKNHYEVNQQHGTQPSPMKIHGPYTSPCSRLRQIATRTNHPINVIVFCSGVGLTVGLGILNNLMDIQQSHPNLQVNMKFIYATRNIQLIQHVRPTFTAFENTFNAAPGWLSLHVTRQFTADQVPEGLQVDNNRPDFLRNWPIFNGQNVQNGPQHKTIYVFSCAGPALQDFETALNHVQYHTIHDRTYVHYPEDFPT